MRRAVRGVQRVATPGRVLWAVAAWLAFSAWFFSVGPYAEMEPHGGVPDERFGDGPGDHLASLDAMGEAGRAAYRAFLWADLAFPLLTALWMAGLLAVATRSWRALPDGVVAVPALVVLFDWLENASFLVLLAQHPDASGAGAVAAVLFQWLKLLANVAAGLLVLAYLVHLVMNPVRRRPARSSTRAKGPGRDGR